MSPPPPMRISPEQTRNRPVEESTTQRQCEGPRGLRGHLAGKLRGAENRRENYAPSSERGRFEVFEFSGESDAPSPKVSTRGEIGECSPEVEGEASSCEDATQV